MVPTGQIHEQKKRPCLIAGNTIAKIVKAINVIGKTEPLTGPLTSIFRKNINREKMENGSNNPVAKALPAIKRRTVVAKMLMRSILSRFIFSIS